MACITGALFDAGRPRERGAKARARLARPRVELGLILAVWTFVALIAFHVFLVRAGTARNCNGPPTRTVLLRLRYNCDSTSTKLRFDGRSTAVHLLINGH